MPAILRELLPRIGGVPQDLGNVADEVHIMTGGPPRIALAELQRLAADHGIEVRDVTPSGGASC